MQRAMVIAVVAVWKMQVTIDEIANVVAVRNGLVPTVGAVDVPLGMAGAGVVRRATQRIGG